MKLKNVVPRIKQKVSVVMKLSMQHEMDSLTISRQYAATNNRIRAKKRSRSTDTAVILHLYYVESWGLISKTLKAISSFSFDIFVSLPKQSLDFENTILKTFPNALVYEAPNRGRDVLPFISIADTLYNKGYKHVLKIHSKKSTHRKDGEDWMKRILAALVPQETGLQESIRNALESPGTGVIGPKGQYVSLTVNFEANGTHMTRIIKKLYSKKQAHKTLQLNRTEYGFFAGTMFWVNLKSIIPLIRGMNVVRRFESESGQIDATFAHALERLFCVIPELEGNVLYEVGAGELNEIDYGGGIVPDWSDVYIGPQPKR